MSELREILNIGKFTILSEGEDKKGDAFMKVMAPWLQVDEPTGNKRIYPKAILQSEIARIQEKVKAGGFLGGGDHHPSGWTTIGNASHVVEKVWMDSGGKCWCEMKILPTAQGKNVMALIKGGATLGLSLTAHGTVHPKTNEVQSGVRLQSIDIVTSPAYKGGTFDKSAIFESVGFDVKKEEHKMKKETPEEAIQLLIERTYELSKEEGTTESLEEWKKSGGEAIVRASVAHSDGKYATIEEALAKMGRTDLADELEQGECHIDPKDVIGEALAAGVDPQKYADLLNKDLKNRQEARRTGWTREKRESILEEARMAGVNVGDHEARMKVLKEHPVIKDNDKDTLFEEEVIARHKMLTESGPEIPLEDVRKVMLKEKEEKEKEEIKQGRIRTFIRESLIAGPPAKKF